MRQSCVSSANRGEKAGKLEPFKEDMELERVKGIESVILLLALA